MTIALNSIFEDGQPDLQAVKVDGDNETIAGSGVDMLGYQGVVFMATAGLGEAATFTLKVQQDSDSAFGAAADLAGTAKTFTTAIATSGFGFVEIKNPQERYLRPALVVPNLNTARPISIVAVRYGKNWRPESNADGELHVSPAEGTA